MRTALAGGRRTLPANRTVIATRTSAGVENVNRAKEVTTVLRMLIALQTLDVSIRNQALTIVGEVLVH